ncbi:MAG: hypothetical protein NTY94_12890 [Alphaproteobacteria bacterium]|nr:hypothetical protein [Alphaproteobacteria bacterium]
MPQTPYIPHIDLLLQALRVNRDRLNSKSKIAIDAKLLKTVLQAMVAGAPFNEAFYKQNYPDLAAAQASGAIPDLHKHFIENGYFEGRFGSAPPVDEAYYTSTYKDVGQAVLKGDVTSGTEHYLRSGASEGRVPNEEIRSELEAWMVVLRE